MMCPGKLDAGIGQETGGGHRPRAENDVAHSGREITLDGVVVPDPAPDLDVDVRELGDESTDDLRIPGRALDRPIEIHEVQAPRPRIHPAPGGGPRIVLELPSRPSMRPWRSRTHLPSLMSIAGIRSISEPRPSSFPLPASTSSGTRRGPVPIRSASSSAARTMRSSMAADASATASSATSNTSSSCTCMIIRNSRLAPGGPLVQRHHGPLDDVGRRTLHRCVDRGAFGVLPAGRIARLDLGKIQAPPEHGLDVAPVARPLPRLLHVRPHSRIAIEVEVDIGLAPPRARSRAGARVRRRTSRR